MQPAIQESFAFWRFLLRKSKRAGSERTGPPYTCSPCYDERASSAPASKSYEMEGSQYSLILTASAGFLG